MDVRRSLYLAAYDIADERRLHAVGRYLGGYRVAGQKSVLEIWVTAAELQQIRRDLKNLIDREDDRVHILGLDPRSQPRLHGRATHFNSNHFAIV